MTPLLKWAENGVLPDCLIRLGIRRLLRARLKDARTDFGDDAQAGLAAFAQSLGKRRIAEDTDKANEQHYEVPPRLFELMLGPRLKYSSGFWPEPTTDLAASEEEMLRMTCERAGLQDGMRILELGCGWGSLTLWMAEHFPHASITAVSNSSTQIPYILAQCEKRGWTHVNAVKCDANDLRPTGAFDRIVSVEMFEHVRNYAELLQRSASWLQPEGRLFVHIFSHRSVPYLFEPKGPADWMSRHFFSGGTMPSHDLLPFFDDHLEVEEAWRINGTHYSRTLEAWLKKLDRNRDDAMPIMVDTYGPELAAAWFQRWRIFLMSCSELFAFRGGNEWGVSHYRFAPRQA